MLEAVLKDGCDEEVVCKTACIISNYLRSVPPYLTKTSKPTTKTIAKTTAKKTKSSLKAIAKPTAKTIKARR